MRILYLHQYFNTLNDSGGTRSYEMARRFVEYGHEVIMITSYRYPTKERDWFHTNERGINIFWLPNLYSNKMSYFQRIISFLKFAIKAGYKAKKFQVDIIFATSTPLTIAIPAIFAKKKLQIPMVFEVRDLWPEVPIAMGVIKNSFIKFLAKKLEDYAYINSNHIVTLSPAMKDILLKRGYANHKVSTIPNSCDFEFFKVNAEVGYSFRRKYKWLNNRPLVVYTGTLGYVNGVSYLVKVAKEMTKINPQVCFVVAGDGIEFDRIKQLAKNSKVYGINFFMLGRISKIEIPALLNASDVTTSLVIDIKSLWANSANKFFDALAAGKPIAINYGGWQKELIEKYNFGIALSPFDYKKAAEELNSILLNPIIKLEMGRNAKKIGYRKFDRSILAKNLLEILENQITKESIC